MEVAFPVVGVSGMGYPSSPSALLGNIEEPSSVAAAFGITTGLPIWRNQGPVSLRIFVKVWGKKKGIFVQVMSQVPAILEHRKAHVEVVRARCRELHLISDFINELREYGLRKERSLLGCRGVRSQNGIAVEIRKPITGDDARKPNSRRCVRLIFIVLTLQD